MIVKFSFSPLCCTMLYQKAHPACNCAILFNLFEWSVNWRTDIWWALVKLDSLESALYNSFRCHLKLFEDTRDYVNTFTINILHMKVLLTLCMDRLRQICWCRIVRESTVVLGQLWSWGNVNLMTRKVIIPFPSLRSTEARPTVLVLLLWGLTADSLWVARQTAPHRACSID